MLYRLLNVMFLSGWRPVVKRHTDWSDICVEEKADRWEDNDIGIHNCTYKERVKELPEERRCGWIRNLCSEGERDVGGGGWCRYKFKVKGDSVRYRRASFFSSPSVSSHHSGSLEVSWRRPRGL